MKNPRLLFSAIIKLLTFLGLMLLLFVFVNSLFTKDTSIQKSTKDETPLVMLELADMYKGQIKKIRWNNREVGVLFRQFPGRLIDQANAVTSENLHTSIKKQIRSKEPNYFVYFNTGDSKNCPLFYGGGIFKDVCSSNKFDEAGRSIAETPQSYMLEIPPHYFEQEKLFIGKWQP